MTGLAHDPAAHHPKPATMLDAVAPIVVLIGLLASTIILFGAGAMDGPLQVALLLSAAFASLVALRNGHPAASVADAAIAGVTSALQPIFMLLAIGALIGTWNMAGTIPTIVDYGIRLMSPSWFYVATAVVCAVVGLITGSSWTTAGTLGVAFVGMARVMGLPVEVAAGAVICGAYFGDKMTPLSETTILVPKLVGRGLTVGTHVRNVFWTSGPALGISLVIFTVLGLNAQPQGEIDTAAVQAALGNVFHLSGLNLLPLLLLLAFTIMRTPPFLALLGSAAFAGLLATVTQHGAVTAFVADPGLGPVATAGTAIFSAMATGFVCRSGAPVIDELFSRGGMTSMLTTVWLILGALGFAAIMEHAGFLRRIIAPIVSRTRRRGSLILAVNATGIGLNIVAGDVYVADVLPSRMFADEFARRGLAPQVLARAVEDAGTVTAVLVPWNTSGAYTAGVLGVATGAYLPYCFFNILSPVLDVLFGFIGFKVPTVEPAEPVGEEPIVTGDGHEL